MSLMGRPSTTTADQSARTERGRRLAAALDETGASQADLARRLWTIGDKVATTTVSKWTLGKAALAEHQLLGLLVVLGLPPDWTPPPAEAPQPETPPARAAAGKAKRG